MKSIVPPFPPELPSNLLYMETYYIKQNRCSTVLPVNKLYWVEVLSALVVLV